jgi:hypothetical protein
VRSLARAICLDDRARFGARVFHAAGCARLLRGYAERRKAGPILINIPIL